MLEGPSTSNGHPPTEKRQKQNDDNIMQTTVFQVPTYNRFGILVDKSNESNNVYTNTNAVKNQDTKKKIIPPIVVTQPIGNYREFIARIKEILESSEFTCQFNNKQTKIYIKTEEHRQIIIDELEKEKVDFHTFTRRDEKVKKIVLKAAPGLNLEEIKEELEFEGVPVVEVIKLRSKSEHIESHSYQICVKKEQNLKELHKITGVANTRVKWEHYAKKNKITQCYRCQEFGHSQANCHKEAKCVKCADAHQTNKCPLPRNIENKVKCVNCQGEHTANYTQCPSYLDYLEKTNESRNKNKRQPHASVNKMVTTNRTYNQATINRTENNSQKQTNTSPRIENNNEMNEMAQIANELKEINKICNLSKMLNLLKQMKVELMQANSFMEHAQIFLKYEDLYQK